MDCFTLHTKVPIDDHVKQLIVSHLEKIFGDLPIDFGIAHLWKNKKTVFLDIKSRSSTVKKQVSKLLKELTNKDLIINPNIHLLKPTNSTVCDLARFKQEKGDERWKTLEHNGPYFKHLYEPAPDRSGLKLVYDGKEYEMTAKEEEVASFYAKRIITEEKSTKKYLDKKEFNANFFTDFKTYFTPAHQKIFKDFKKFDFSNLVLHFKQIKEQKEEEKRLKRESRDKERQLRAGKKKENKEKEKEKKESDPERICKLERKLNFCYAYVDGIKKEIRNSAVELPGLYVGSGNVMTNKGKIKQTYNPEDVTINVSKDCIPLPPKGYRWGKVVHDTNANWTARYKDKTTGKYKYILLAETGDLLKFEKARKLNHYIDVVDKRIRDLLNSDSAKENQIGCALYLIKEYGIRVGNECEDECDSSEKVVGATTLMVQNMKCRKGKDYCIDLSFIGKDSITYENTLTVCKKVYDHMSNFAKRKKGTDNVFGEITSTDVNKYLKSIDKDFSAKVFRTRLASSMMYDGLMDFEHEDKTKEQKLTHFNKINRLVAIKLNHKKGLTEAMKDRLVKEQEKIDEIREKYQSEKDEKKKKKLKLEIESKELKLSEKDESKEIALDTSKKNYIDPRIIKAWSEQVLREDKEEEGEEEEEEIKHCVDQIYTKAHLKHFRWAIEDTSIDEFWDYYETELDPMVGKELYPE